MKSKLMIATASGKQYANNINNILTSDKSNSLTPLLLTTTNRYTNVLTFTPRGLYCTTTSIAQ